MSFRFGMTNSTTEGWTAAARRAEQLGYATFLLPDTTHLPAPLPALAVAAGATRDLHVGTWVLCEPLYDRRHLVRDVGAMTAVLGERFELGIGAGRPGAEADAAALGVPFGSPAERMARLEGTVAALRDAGTKHVMIAASGPRMLALAGRLADTVALGWAPDTDEATARARVAAVRDAAGDRPVELATGLVAVGDGEHPWLRVSPHELAERGAVTVVSGSHREMADQLLHRRDALGVEYVTVPAADAETFAPVVALLAGQ